MKTGILFTFLLLLLSTTSHAAPIVIAPATATPAAPADTTAATTPYPPPPQGIQWGWQGAVLFQLNSAQLAAQYQPMLLSLTAHLQRYPEIQVLITGHTDNTGNVDYNRQLSTQRVDAVARFFQQQGILPRRIITQAAGEQRPTSSNACASDRQRNRRADIAFFPQGMPPASVALVTGETAPQAGECEAQQILEQVR